MTIMRKMRGLALELALLPILIIGSIHSSHAQQNLYFLDLREPASLKELKKVALKVDVERGVPLILSSPPQPVSETVEALALKSLREAGIEAISIRESQSSLDVPILALRLYFVCPPGASCGYHTELELIQQVQLTRNRSITVPAVTWHVSYTNVIDKVRRASVPDYFMVQALASISGFIGDYRRGNSK